ncbi:LbtU family siderophore porin [bacterium]|nr:LbtU family siderophore porin [bacterium]
MKHNALILATVCFTLPCFAVSNNNEQLQQDIVRLQQQTTALQAQLSHLQKQLVAQQSAPKAVLKPEVVSQPKHKSAPKPKPKPKNAPIKSPKVSDSTKVGLSRARKSAAANPNNSKPVLHPELKMEPQFHQSTVSINSPDVDPEALEFYPTALVADNRVLTYIAGTPVVSSPYLGSRPAFDGSDYIVNISSINRDIRLMQQRRSLDRAYAKIGYPIPDRPILAISGKAEPIGTLGQPYFGESKGDWTLGSNELDVAAILNDKVEAYMAIAYDAAPPAVGGQRVSNSSLGLNMGFVNIGDLDKSPFYFTAGQLFTPFGRFSTAMVSAPLTMRLARTKARPVILGYKSQKDTGPFAAIYGYRGDTTLGSSGVGGLNLGYIVDAYDVTGEIGGSFISAIDDAGGMQFTGSVPGTTFAGFGSPTNGSENVHKVPAAGAHCSLSFDRYNITAEWVGAADSFRAQDLSFNGVGARPQAVQLEGGLTFMAFDKPSSVSLGYQWSKAALALNLPEHRLSGVFNISIWKDTIESLEYRHDIDYNSNQFANGASAPGFVNANTFGTGGASDTLLVQIGVYF